MSIFAETIWSHWQQAWALKDDPNMMLVWYEDMLEDLPKVIREVCKFLGKSLTEEEISRLSDSLQIDNFRLLGMNKIGR